MSSMSLQTLAQLEPWRLGKGQPRNALDPSWTPSVLNNLCDGEIDWEGGTGWWVCKKCGYVGSAYFNKHRPVESPAFYFLHSVLFYINKRAEEPSPVSPERALADVFQQMLFIAGAALRYAATQKTKDLGKYVDKLVVE